MFFDGFPEPPGSLGGAQADPLPAANAPELTPSALDAGISVSDRGRRRPGPPLALAFSLAGVVLAHAAGLAWGKALALVVLVVAATTAGATVVALYSGVRVSGEALGLVPPAAPAVLRVAQALLRPTRAPRLSRPRQVYIIGDEDFRRRVSAAAGNRRLVTGQWHFDGTSEAVLPGHLGALPEMDELVIDGRCFDAFCQRTGWTPQCRGRVRVVPSGASADTAFSDPLGPAPRLFKRVFDIAFSLTALLLAAPCLLLAMLAIRLDSRGPALFKQVRVGHGGRRFTLYKLRTMTTGEEDPAVLAYMADMVRCRAEPENGLFKLGSNRRITRVGRWLRRLSIDEVPQLLNVLKGDMSVVGPRPSILEEAACYSEVHWQRLAVRPGITGLAQVNGRSRLRFDDIVDLDVRYSRSWTPLLELKILLRTPAAVVSGRGAT